jgi:hypothetical protein
MERAQFVDDGIADGRSGLDPLDHRVGDLLGRALEHPAQVLDERPAERIGLPRQLGEAEDLSEVRMEPSPAIFRTCE